MKLLPVFKKTMMLIICLLMASCASTDDPALYAHEMPRLDLQRYFNGTLDAWGMFQDRSGKIVKRFTVVIQCQWNGDVGTLDENFTYADGSKQKRIWTLTKVAPDHFTGKAGDVIGEAQGIVSGNTLHWKYVLALPVDDSVYHVDFDDVMVLMNGKVMLNRAIMRKFGVELGSVTLSFARRSEQAGE
ncbi:DUF3833 domain-containing protein [Undibacterium oligocarboniphilum]|uniref:DUF3833 domain-containing protein n=1 Tax=Undibacterium oligocarboniphilum TaxID=666702 RepID=A0A850QAK8_9BURK|nr:DUF3833 domain-containing protein [Undibacterium oligocarboniphilum]MBC3871009.1 DUF3833 domain-containing protein [Undibacterium oligocarboniphilum]NVO76368.1 DUF3833 domain-containing protein [Undibacterium oligocarboniphilum]